MKRRVTLCISVLLVASAIPVVVLISRSHEPVYQGVGLNQWLDAYNRVGLSASNGPNIEPVSRAICAMGTNSLPFLLKHLMHRDSVIAQKFFDLAEKQHLFKLPVHQDYAYYAPSVLALMVLGPDARPILPALLKAALNSSDQKSLFAMLALGTNAIPTLELACLSTDRETRSQAALYIAALESAGPQPLLHWDWDQGPVGGHPLLKIHDKRPADYGTELVNLLKSPDAAVRLASADAIGTHPLMRMPVESAMSLLSGCLNDPNPEVRKSAAEALKELHAVAPIQALRGTGGGVPGL